MAITQAKVFTNNDLYFMEVVSNRIVINNNYDGVCVLDNELNVVKIIDVFENLLIYSSFIHDNGIVLYCCENRCLVYINVESYACSVIALNSEFDEIVFLTLYEWSENELILLASPHGELVRTTVNLLEKSAIILTNDSKHEQKYWIQEYWGKLSGSHLLKVYHDRHIAVIDSNDTIVMVDYKNDVEDAIELERIRFHDIEVAEDCVAQISEEIVSVTCRNMGVLIFPKSEDYRFLRGKFITKDNSVHLLLLLGYNPDSKIARIERYSVDSIEQGFRVANGSKNRHCV